MSKFEEGQMVRVLDGARSNTDPASTNLYEELLEDFEGDIVEITRAMDSDGDYLVQGWYIAEEFLAEVHDPDNIGVGDRVKITQQFEAEGVTVTYEGTVTAITSDAISLGGLLAYRSHPHAGVLTETIEILEKAKRSIKVGDEVTQDEWVSLPSFAVVKNKIGTHGFKNPGGWDNLGPDDWRERFAPYTVVYLP